MRYFTIFMVFLGSGLSFIVNAQESAPELKKGFAVQVGLMRVDGDVDARIIDGKTIGASYSHDLSKLFNLELNYFYGRSKGVDTNPGFFNPYTDETYWFPSSRTDIHNLSISAGLRLDVKGKIELQLAYGPGLLLSQTYMNVLDENKESYANAREEVPRPAVVTYKEHRKQILDYLDNTYETKAITEGGAFDLFGTPIYISHKVTGRILFYTKYKIKLALNASVIVVNNDYLDGVKYRTETEITNNADLIHRIVMSVHYPL